jgi:hypothetical protein
MTARWRVGVALLVAVAAALLAPVPGWAAGDPPPVTGLPIDKVEAVLRQWDQGVVITYSPPLAELPPSLDPGAVVALSRELVGAAVPTTAAVSPQVRVVLGTVVPDLTGMTASAAEATAKPVGFQTDANPLAAGPDWVVRGQRPAAGLLAPVGSVVTLILVAPSPAAVPSPTPSASPPPPRVAHRGPPVLVAAVAGGSGLVAVLAGLLTVTSLRRRRRRERHRPQQTVVVRVRAGRVVGPDLHDHDSRAHHAIRISSRPGAATVSVREDGPAAVPVRDDVPATVTVREDMPERAPVRSWEENPR